MESKDLRERTEWEVRRVVTAFQAKNYVFSPHYYLESAVQFEVPLESEVTLYMKLSPDPVVTVVSVQLVCGGELLFMNRTEKGRWDKGCSRLNSIHQSRMARGFYCLGIEDEGTCEQLPPLSAHEKLELRLSLPREFWPQKWLDEE
ncbi:hypothetical protein EON83_15010 [bacterium]|nr:MAG: hypothetical protein EON83_15010 [bacterium]